MVNYYALLGVRPDASREAIKTAYRALVRQVHPDAAGDAERFRRLQAAYEVLRDREQRAQYDHARQTWMTSCGAVACAACGHANRITRRPSESEIVRCWHCKSALSLSPADLSAAQRQSLAHEGARLLEEVGVELADLAADAVRTGIFRLRDRLGIVGKKTRRTGG